MEPLNPYLVYIDSRKRISGTDSNFLYNISLPQDHTFDRVVVLNALIPKSYFLIQAGYNTFQLQENNTTVTITVPVGNYSFTAWKTEIGNLLTAASPNSLTYSLSYPSSNSTDTGKFTYTQNNGSIASKLIFTQYLFEPFGFLQNSTNTFTGTTLQSTCVIKMQSEDRLLIHSDCVNNPSQDDVLVSINASTYINYSSISYTNVHPAYNNHVLKSTLTSTISIVLTDENNIVLDLNGLNMNLTLLFYKRDDIFDRIRNMLKLSILEK
jgi:hypothetical protein